MSDLRRREQLVTKIAARTHTVDEYARVLVQHKSVVHMKETLLTEKQPHGPGYKSWVARQQNTAPKYGYIGYGSGEEEPTLSKVYHQKTSKTRIRQRPRHRPVGHQGPLPLSHYGMRLFTFATPARIRKVSSL